MAQANGRAAGANAEVPQLDEAAVADRAVPLVNQAVLPQMEDARVPVAGPPVAPMAVAPFPQALVPAHFDVDGALLGPMARKSNGSCKFLPKIVGESEP